MVDVVVDVELQYDRQIVLSELKLPRIKGVVMMASNTNKALSGIDSFSTER